MYYPSSENKGADQRSFAVTAKLICASVFAYADCWFSHEAAQLKLQRQNLVQKRTDENLKFCSTQRVRELVFGVTIVQRLSAALRLKQIKGINY